ncbi:MAG TPA: bifunctional ADP-heptose synthase [Candidatus Andersenbacteria bacterium]|nr:bifunctional ADP-heptose synthase [Candidatus Andersenbacteria bacterium]
MSIALQRAQEIASQFAGKRLLVIGDVFLDRYIFGVVERLNPEAPVPILHAKKEENATGGAGNTAKNAAMFGASVVCIGVVGNDEVGNSLEATAKKENYTPVFIRDSRMPTIVKKRYIVGSQQLLRVDHEELLECDPVIEQQCIDAIISHAEGVDGIIISDYAKGAITERVAEAVLAIMREKNIPVMVDAKPSRVTYFTGATYMSPNRKEAHEYLGIPSSDAVGKNAHELAEMVSESFDTNVFLTLSSEGMYIKEKNQEGIYIPTNYISYNEVVDTSGCGDTAAVTILLAKLAGATSAEAAELGNAAGATVAKKTGAVGISQEELLHTIEDHHE